MILIKDKDLEPIKLIKKYNDEEYIYQLKDKSLNNNFFIITETMPEINPEDNIHNCIEMDTLEEAEKQVNAFLSIRKFLKTLPK